MNSAAETDTVREHTKQLLTAIEVSRVIVVDDQYSDDVGVEEVIGICAQIGATRAAELPHLSDIDFEADHAIWAAAVRDRWQELDTAASKELKARFLAFEAEQTIASEGDLARSKERVDRDAATTLGEILNLLDDCEYRALSLAQWKAQADEIFSDDKAATTLLLFDRDFSREQEGTEDEGFNLIRAAQLADVGCCGLISHTVPLDGEVRAWSRLAADRDLNPDKFVVISKERLTGRVPDVYGFLRMLRFTALSERYASVRSQAWRVFGECVAEAEAAVDKLSVLDFDRIVFESSRQEGVWEPDTLFRVFSILMRREARSRLHANPRFLDSVVKAREISALPETVAAALGEEPSSSVARCIQRYEIYELAEELNRFNVPIDLGDMFQRGADGPRYILLAQPCDLMVRENGKRSYEDAKFGRTAALVKVVEDSDREKPKDSWAELPFYHQAKETPAFADFAQVHQVRLAVLDLCSLREDGTAKIDVETPSPDLAIEPWKRRYNRLCAFFGAALNRYEQMEGERLGEELQILALPTPSATIRLDPVVSEKSVRYQLKRVMRLRQPWSGALLTAFAQYQARAAFEHPLHRRLAE